MKYITHRLELRHYDSYTGGGCRVYNNGELVKGCTAGGCGYDREGAALGNFLMTLPKFKEGIKHLLSNHGSGDKPTGYYGLSHYNKLTNKWQKRSSKNTRSSVDGACGKSTIINIAKAVGIDVEWTHQTKNSNFYLVSSK